MNFYLIAQHEVAYLKNNKNEIVRKYFSPKEHFFLPGSWEFEIMPKDFFLKTINFKEFSTLFKAKD